MTLTLHFHPLSSFCHKALIAFYENDIPFTPHLVDLGDEASRNAFLKLWPIGKFPVLQDDARGEIVPESTTIIEYLQQHYPGPSKLIPADAQAAREVRLKDRMFDWYVHIPMQKIVGDRLRPQAKNDPHGVEDARRMWDKSLGVIERDMADKTWAAGETFTLADCAAAPALFYANKVTPLAGRYDNTSAYLDRLMKRPSYARALKEAEPYMRMFPG